MAYTTDTVAKFQDPKTTAKGEPRAHVVYRGTKTLWFNTGTLCNIECTNCYIESSPRNDRLVYLTKADVIPFLDELDAAGEGGCEIGFTGGEPFMAPEIIDILRVTLERGFTVLMLTNAMQPMMRPRIQEGLLALNDQFGSGLVIRVSLDHYTATFHDRERGPGAFGLALQGLQWL
ncbi:MAG: radical SAM protein, partial [Pseudomonadota bacterium]